MKRLVIASTLALLTACSTTEAGEPQLVTGLITKIEKNLITVRTSAGAVMVMELADTTVSPEHLRVLIRDRLPVTITPDPVGDRLLARNIVDAPSSTTVPGHVPIGPPG